MTCRNIRILLLCAIAPCCALGAPADDVSDAKPKWASLEDQMRRDPAGLVPREHAGHRQSVALEGRFLHMSVARRDSSGAMRVQCFDDYGAMNDALTGATVCPAAKEASDEGVVSY